jgi:hypothetical protein
MLSNLEEYQSNIDPFHTDTNGDVLHDGEGIDRGMKSLISNPDDDGLLNDEEVPKRIDTVEADTS